MRRRDHSARTSCERTMAPSVRRDAVMKETTRTRVRAWMRGSDSNNSISGINDMRNTVRGVVHDVVHE